MSSIQSSNLCLFVGFLYRLLGNGIWPVRGVRSRCSTIKSKRCYGNNYVKVNLYSLLLDIYPTKKRNACSDIFPFSLPFLVQVV